MRYGVKKLTLEIKTNPNGPCTVTLTLLALSLLTLLTLTLFTLALVTPLTLAGR